MKKNPAAATRTPTNRTPVIVESATRSSRPSSPCSRDHPLDCFAERRISMLMNVAVASSMTRISAKKKELSTVSTAAARTIKNASVLDGPGGCGAHRGQLLLFCTDPIHAACDRDVHQHGDAALGETIQRVVARARR